MIPAMSPIRWFWGYLLTAEAQLWTDVLKQGAAGRLSDKGYDLRYLKRCGIGVPDKKAVRLPQAWASRQGWVCTVSEMLLLGLLFRTTAVVCLLLYTSAQSS